MLADCLAGQGDHAASPYLDRIAQHSVITAQAIRAQLLWNTGETHAGSDLLLKVLDRLHQDPWLSFGLSNRSLLLANEISNADSSNATAIAFFNMLNTPLAVRNEETARIDVLFNLGLKIDGAEPAEYTKRVLQLLEPNVPWQSSFLRARQISYQNTGDPEAAQAKRDVDAFIKNEAADVETLARQINPEPAPTAR
jgi:hypothetical protein